MIYLVTVNYYSTELIANLLASLAMASDRLNICPMLIVVNNSVDDPLVQTLAGERILILQAEKNLGFGAGCNLGLRWVYEREPDAIVWLINPDARLSPSALEAAWRVCTTRSELSIVGTVVQQPDGALWFGGGMFTAATGEIASVDLVSTHPSVDYLPCDWVTGCSLLVNLRNFSSCPHFDPAYFLYYEDFDFCRRYAAIGHTVGIAAQVVVIHSPSSITNRNLQFKFRHSTFSYLLTLERYTKGPARLVRLLRVVLYAAVLLGWQPAVAIGKFSGVWMYLRRMRCFGQPTSS